MSDELQTVKIGLTEYREVKALAKKRGQHLMFVLTRAIRQYLDRQATPVEAEKE